MKKILKLSLAAMAIAALAACGGGDGGSDAADVYVGSWKSNCFSYVATNGNTYYQTYVLKLAKASASELAGTSSNSIAHSDSACKNSLGSINDSGAIQINIGTRTTFLGAAADNMVYKLVTTGEARPGWITATATQLNLVVVSNDGKPPVSWSFSSPFTKQ
jgi:hypothetical protein